MRSARSQKFSKVTPTSWYPKSSAGFSEKPAGFSAPAGRAEAVHAGVASMHSRGRSADGARRRFFTYSFYVYTYMRLAGKNVNLHRSLPDMILANKHVST